MKTDFVESSHPTVALVSHSDQDPHQISLSSSKLQTQFDILLNSNPIKQYHGKMKMLGIATIDH